MLNRRSRRIVVVAALAAMGFGLFASVGAAPSWQWNRADQISSRQPTDQATMATPDRRIARAQAATSNDPFTGLSSGAAAGLAALLAFAGVVSLPRLVRRRARIEQYLAWALRSPPAPVPALVPVR